MRLAWNIVIILAILGVAWMLLPRVVTSIDNAMRQRHREVTGVAFEGVGYLMTGVVALASLLMVSVDRLGVKTRLALALGAVIAIAALMMAMLLMPRELLKHFWREPAMAIVVVLVAAMPAVVFGRGIPMLVRHAWRWSRLPRSA